MTTDSEKHTSPRPGTDAQGAPRTPELRARVHRAFRKGDNGIDERTAYRATRSWYRSAGRTRR